MNNILKKVTDNRLLTAVLLLLVAGLLSFNPNLVSAQDDSGSSKRQYRTEALRSIPFQQLNQQTKDKIAPVVQKPSIYRRLPVKTIQVDPDYYRFLVRHPETVIGIWQLMGVTQMTID